MPDQSQRKYISLKEAAEIFRVSQNYLRFLIFQKKLRAVKMGRNWVTTAEWIREQRQTAASRNGNGGAVHESRVCENYFHSFPPPSLVLEEMKIQPAVVPFQKKELWRTRVAVQLAGLALIAFFARSNILESGVTGLPEKISQITHADFSSAAISSFFREAEPPTPRELTASVYSSFRDIFERAKISRTVLPSFSSFVQWFSGAAPEEAPETESMKLETRVSEVSDRKSEAQAGIPSSGSLDRKPVGAPPREGSMFQASRSITTERREILLPADTSRIDEKLESLNQYVLTNVSKLFTELTQLSGKVDGKTAFTVFAQSQKIDQLFNPTIRNGMTIASGDIDSRGAFLFDGSGRIGGTLNVSGSIAAGAFSVTNSSSTSLSVSNLLTVSGTGTSTFAGGVSTAGLDSSNGLRVSVGDTVLAGGIQVTGSGHFLSTLGVATTAPGALLSVSGSVLAQTGTSTFGGVISPSVFSTTSLAFYAASAAMPAIVITSSGNVGIGTTSPWGLLSVNPNGITGPAFAVGSSTQCVTGDTKLRRRKRRKTNGKTEYEYDEVEIKNIKAGDEVASLNEKTGRVVWSKVNALMDMGVKTTFRLRTEDGREIRTTDNHPYYIRVDSVAGLPVVNVGDKNSVGILQNKFHAVVARAQPESFLFAPFKFNYVGMLEGMLQSFKFGNTLENAQANMLRDSDDILTRAGMKGDREHAGYVARLARRITSLSGIQEFFRSASRIRLAVSFAASGVESSTKSMMSSSIFLDNMRRGAITPRTLLSSMIVREDVFIHPHPNSKKFHASRGVWMKVMYLRPGMEVGVPSEDGRLSWVKIASIEKVGEERVYDIEVEGTHNFIGNDIVAHNTYLTITNGGSVGIGTTSPGALLSVKGPFLVNSTSPSKAAG